MYISKPTETSIGKWRILILNDHLKLDEENNHMSKVPYS